MSEIAVIGVALLLPLTALLTLKQENILHAVMCRALFGVAAALLYALLGAPDVAVTEVLVGALLVTLLYVVIFKRTREIRVGVIEARCLEGKACLALTAFCRDRGFRERNIYFADEAEVMEALEEELIDAAFLDRTPGGFHSIPQNPLPGLPRVVVPAEAWDLLEVLDPERGEDA